jgi:ABC-type branched-subunit amino acid transport system substrate-binding protein
VSGQRLPHTLAARAAGAAVALAILVPLVAAAAGLTPAERRGKQIYHEGRGRGSIAAVLSGPAVTAAGPSFPCSNCHLAEGSGTTEAGVRSADITFATLAKEFRGTRASGRAHPPYTEDGLKVAILGGHDPAGQPLHEAHPRYQMDERDLEDLVAYLKVLGREPVPGVSDDEIRVGMLLPDRGPLAAAGRSVEALLTGHFAAVNAGGGVFRRRLTLVPVRFDPSTPGAAEAAARARIQAEDVFGFLANLGVPPDDPAGAALAAARVPVLAPLLVVPQAGYGDDPFTFHVYASLHDQARLLVDFLARESGERPARAALLYASDPAGRAGAAGAKEQMQQRGLAPAAETAFTPGALDASAAVNRMQDAAVDAVLFFGPGADALRFIGEADSRGWRPRFLSPASMVAGSLLAAPARVLAAARLASPAWRSEDGAPGAREFARLVAALQAPASHRPFQLLAYAGARILHEGLLRAGRGVSRARLADSLGTLREFRTGVTPPLTYNQNRRVGASGATILTHDPDTGHWVTAAPWREPRP